jgi:hypothetical protein
MKQRERERERDVEKADVVNEYPSEERLSLSLSLSLSLRVTTAASGGCVLLFSVCDGLLTLQ